MKQDEFIANLTLYGADTAQWPDVLRRDAEAMLAQSPALQALADAERVFEDRMNAREYTAPDKDLAYRIIHMATPRAKRAGFWESFVDDVMGAFALPRPALAFATVGALGLMVGFLTLNAASTAQTTDDTYVTTWLYDSEDTI